MLKHDECGGKLERWGEGAYICTGCGKIIEVGIYTAKLPDKRRTYTPADGDD